MEADGSNTVGADTPQPVPVASAVEWRPHYPLFNYIRLFLALEVVWLHIPVAHRGNQLLVLPIDPVPAFIAISGFLVFQSLQRTTKLSVFWRNRALRVLPAFFLALVVTFVLHGSAALRDSLLSYVRMQPVIGKGVVGSNFALWSLSVEEVLYALMVVLTVVGAYKVRHFHRGFFWVAFCLMAVYSVIRIRHAMDGDATGFAVGFSFVAGTYMADSPYLPVVRKFWWAFIAVSLLVAGSYVNFSEVQVRGALFSLMVVGGALGVLGLGTLDVKVPQLRNDLSYGLYVLHLPMLALCDKMGLTGWVYIVTAFALSLTAAALSWFLVEKPMLALKARSSQPALG